MKRPPTPKDALRRLFPYEELASSYEWSTPVQRRLWVFNLGAFVAVQAAAAIALSLLVPYGWAAAGFWAAGWVTALNVAGLRERDRANARIRASQERERALDIAAAAAT